MVSLQEIHKVSAQCGSLSVRITAYFISVTSERISIRFHPGGSKSLAVCEYFVTHLSKRTYFSCSWNWTHQFP